MIGLGQSQPNVFADPGNTQAVIFEAPSRLAKYQATEIWIGAAGSSEDWGSCNVFVSSDGVTYKQIGTIEKQARLGTLASSFASGSDPDSTDSLVVNLVENSGPLESGTTQDADQNNLLCYVDGELVSYSACASTGQDQYTMNGYIRRGVLGSAIGAHAAGSSFLFLDDAVIQFDYDSSWSGQTVYFKFQSVNSFGNAAQSLSAVTAIPFVIPGQGTNFSPAQTTDIVNPDFEISSDLPPYGWMRPLLPGGTPSMAYDSSTPYAGVRSFVSSVISGAGSTVIPLFSAQKYVVTPGDTYKLSAAMKMTGGGSGSSVGVKFAFVDANGASVSGGASDINVSQTSGSWAVASASGVVPAGAVAAYLSLFIKPNGTLTTGEWDSVQLKRMPNLGSEVTGTLPIASVGSRSGSVSFVIDGGGAVVSTGVKGSVSIPANATITGWVITADQVGSAVVDVLRSTYSGYPTTSSIAGTDKPTLSSAQKNQDSALSGWGNTALSLGDILQFNVNSCTTCTRLNITLTLSIAG